MEWKRCHFFAGPPSINWIDRKKTSGENRTGRKRCHFFGPSDVQQGPAGRPVQLGSIVWPTGTRQGA
jgi:hypothetical protein